MNEVWRPVVGYEDFYEVSSLGRVRSVNRAVVTSNCHSRTFRSRVLAQGLSSGGYPIVNLVRNGRGKTNAVHRLVLAAFVGPKPQDMEACHANHIRTDNRVENLRWDTRSGNLADSSRDGRLVGRRGERRNKLTRALVLMARYRHAEGETVMSLAKQLGVTNGTLSMAIRGITWRNP